MGRGIALPLFGLAITVLAAACFSPRERNCVISCATGESCPSGMQCTADGLCAETAATACLAARGDAGVDGGPGDDGAVPVIIPPEVLGDIVTLTFDPSPFHWSGESYVGIDRSVRDRSGNGINGFVRAEEESGATARADGIYGAAAPFASALMREIYLPLEGMPATFTFEAWIAPEGGGDVRSLITNNNGINVYWELYLDEPGHLVFEAGQGDCEGGRSIVVSEAVVPNSSIDEPDFTYVAATYDEASRKVELHVGDEMVSQVLVTDLCPAFNVGPVILGRRHLDSTSAFRGVMDEVKLSARVKSQAELQNSRGFDSTILVERCGDGIVEGGEDCELGSGCCDPDTCRLRANGASCSGGGSCTAGICIGATSTIPVPLARYTFEEGNQAERVVDDAQGVTPLDIFGEATWDLGAGQITLHAKADDVQPQRLQSQGAVAEIVEAIRSQDEVSVHLRIAPSALNQSGPARILSIAPDVTRRNIMVGQEGPFVVVRTRTSVGAGEVFDGLPAIVAPRLETGKLTDIIYVRANDGEERIYVNGVLVARGVRAGDLADWSSEMSLALGDELNTSPPDTRPWVGTFHLVEIYGAALSPEHVASLATE